MSVRCRPAILVVLAATVVASLLGVTSAAGELRPALPVHAWRQHKHSMGFVSVTESGEPRFAVLITEDTTEADHPGFWIEKWKVEQLRTIFPSVPRSFQFGETITVKDIRYVRVLPAARISDTIVAPNDFLSEAPNCHGGSILLCLMSSRGCIRRQLSGAPGREVDQRHAQHQQQHRDQIAQARPATRGRALCK